jgi:hypothetical protein
MLTAPGKCAVANSVAERTSTSCARRPSACQFFRVSTSIVRAAKSGMILLCPLLKSTKRPKTIREKQIFCSFAQAENIGRAIKSFQNIPADRG